MVGQIRQTNPSLTLRDENGQERAGKPLNYFRFRFLLWKTGAGANSRVRERKRDITVMETGRNWKIYRNVLLFNHHSFCINITLDTPLHKLFFKNIINISCFLLLNCEICVLMLRNMRGYMVCQFIFPQIL